MNTETTDHERGSLANRVWACQVLGIGTDASPQEMHAGALAQLEKEQFVPPPPLEQAVLFLADEAPRELWIRDGGGEMLCSTERELRKAVYRLALTFFALQPARRRAAWHLLKKKTVFSIPLTSRLDALAAGLDVTLPAFGDDGECPAVRLAKGVCEAFVMLPSGRAAWHEEQLRCAMADPRRWQSVARDLARRYPELVQLAPELIVSMSQAVRRSKVVARAARATTRAMKKKLKAATRRAPRAWSWFQLWPLIAVAIGGISGALQTASNTGTNRAPSVLPVPPRTAPIANVPHTSSWTPPENRLPSDVQKLWRDTAGHDVVPPPPSPAGKKNVVEDSIRSGSPLPDSAGLLLLQHGNHTFHLRATGPPLESKQSVQHADVPDLVDGKHVFRLRATGPPLESKQSVQPANVPERKPAP
jgi:hypothetical protein